MCGMLLRFPTTTANDIIAHVGGVMNKQQLASKIWQSANKMRSKREVITEDATLHQLTIETIEGLSGSEFDMKGLNELQSLLRGE